MSNRKYCVIDIFERVIEKFWMKKFIIFFPYLTLTDGLEHFQF